MNGHLFGLSTSRCPKNIHVKGVITILTRGLILNVERGQSIVNHQGHLPQLQQQMQINIAVFLCMLTSWFITKCSKKARQEEKKMHSVALTVAKRELI